jgi:hypothetical protein
MANVAQRKVEGRWMLVYETDEDVGSYFTECAWGLEHRLVHIYGMVYNVLSHHRNGFWANTNKSEGAKYSFKSARFYKYPSTTLKECQLCGKLSTPKKIVRRWSVYRWNANGKHDYETESKDTLCMGCWNKIRVLVKRQEVCDQSRRLIAKLKEETRKWVKLQQQVS